MSNYRKIVSKILTEANSFWADSGVVDVTYAPVYNFENGKPVTVEAYHMTPHTFTKFKIGQVNAWGKGVYLTNNPEDCSFNPETMKDWNKMRLFATFFKPFVYEDEIGDEFRNWLWSEIQNVVNEATIRNSEISKHKLESENLYMDAYYRLLFKNTSGESFKKQSSLNVMYTIQRYDEMFGLNVYKQLGLDGMILPFGKTGMADEQNKNTVWYVCYKPNQIKSVETNNGDYNLDSDDINEGVESVKNSFYEYTNTDKNAIGFSGVNTYAEQGDSYTMIVDMSPQEFLSLSTVNFIKDDIPWFEEQVKNGVPLAMPYLEIEIEDPKKKIARVYGHEGRHRSLAVSNLGYTQAQCILWIRDFTRAGYKKEDLKGWTIMGQKPRIGNKNTHENNSFTIK